MTLAEKEHTKLCEFMLKNAVKFPKKHGNWLRFYLGSRTFLSMDSWNSAIHVIEGSCVYSYWAGFRECKTLYLGGNFGGFNKGAGFLTLREWLKRAINTI